MNFTLITGASKGIGRALAIEFARFNCNLLLTARSEKELKELAAYIQEEHGVRVKVFVLDLLADGAVDQLYDFCLQEKIRIRILVNNAGFGMWQPFKGAEMDKLFNMMRLNQNLVLELCHRFLPMLQESAESHILNVASTAAFQPLPGFSVYAASKAFVLSFSQSLRFELKGSVNVSCLCPGPTDTDFFSSAGFDGRLGEAEGIKMPVEEVARKAVDGLLAKKAVLVPGFTNKIGGFFSKVLPSSLTTNVIGRIMGASKKH